MPFQTAGCLLLMRAPGIRFIQNMDKFPLHAKTMKLHTHNATICLSAIFAAMLSACTTTGNPNEGGLFWSPSKAMERRQTLQAELAAKQATLDGLQKTTASYSTQKAKLLKQRDELKARKAAATSLQDEASINAAIKDIEAELERM